MVVLVCGGRSYSDGARLFEELEKIHTATPITLLVEGQARGADALANCWAKLAGIPTKRYPADWGRYGKAAGFIRNATMLADAKPELVVAFPGGRGTADMVRRARQANVMVREVV